MIYSSSWISNAGGSAGIITSLQFNTTSLGVPASALNNWTLYLGNTTQNGYPNNSSWLTANKLTQVFKGTISYPSIPGWFTITLTQPFYWDGISNLCVGIDENSTTSTTKSPIYQATSQTAPLLGSWALQSYGNTTTETYNFSPFAPPTFASSTTSIIPNIKLTILPPTVCTGSPYLDALTTSIHSDVCGSDKAFLSTGNIPQVGIDYTWEQSYDSLNWTTIVGETKNCYYAAPIGETLFYRMNATCSGITTTSNVVSVSGNTATTCFCIPSSTTTSYWIKKVSTNRGLVNINKLSNASATYGYMDAFDTDSAIVSPGDSMTLSIEGSGTSTYNFFAWVDWNNNGVFGDQENEYLIYNVASGYVNSYLNIHVKIPTNLHYGTFRLRVAMSFSGFVYPCKTNNFYAQYHDYKISVEEPPTCRAPTNITKISGTESTATFSWKAPTTSVAIGYEYFINTTGIDPSKDDSSSGIFVNTATSGTITGLLPSTTYYIWFRSLCSSSDTSVWDGPYNIYTNYCVPINRTTSNQAYYLNNINTLGAIANISYKQTSISGSKSVYRDSSSSYKTVTYAGQSFTLNLGFSYLSGALTRYAVWVDWNDDYDFNDSLEIIYFSSIREQNTKTITFNTPASAPMGNHRMRIQAGYYLYTATTPCGGFLSVFDYYNDFVDVSLQVIATPTCFGPTNVRRGNATPNSAQILWSRHASNTSIIGYDIFLTTSNVAPSFNQIPTVSTSGLNDTTTLLTGLIPNSTYYVYVRSKCSVNDSSYWSGPLVIYTNYCLPTNGTTTIQMYSLNQVSITGALTNFSNPTSKSGSTSIYQDYSASISATVYPTNAVKINLGYNYSSPNYARYGVWVDWNDDLDFNDSLEIVYISAAAEANSKQISYTIPSTAPFGNHRMRVAAGYSSYYPSTPCNTVSYAYYCDFEDYTLIVVDSSSCLKLTNINDSICSGSYYYIDGKNIKNAGIYTLMNVGENNCDSVVVLTLKVLPEIKNIINASICAGETYAFAGKNYNAAGTYSDTSLNVLGCDSITTLQLMVKTFPYISLNDSLSVCGSSTILDAGIGIHATYLWNDGSNGQTLTVSNSGFYSVVKTDLGCSSSDSIYVDLLNVDLGNDTAICAGESINLQSLSSGSQLVHSLSSNLRNGLVGYWPFNGNANDESGNGNHGTVNGATLTSDRFGLQNKAYLFDGGLNNIFIGNSKFDSLSELTVSAYVKTTDINGGYVISTGNLNEFAVSINSSGQFVGETDYLPTPNGTGNFQISTRSNTGNNQGEWKFVTMTFDGQTNKLYVNGNLVDVDTAKAPMLITHEPSYLSFGSYYYWGNVYPDSAFNFAGIIDDISIHNRALSTQEIQQLYLQGKPSFLWSTGDTTSSINVSPAQTTTYYCTINNGYTTCADSVVVTVKPFNPVTFADTITSQTPRLLLDAGLGNNATYLWNNGDTNQTILVSQSGKYSVVKNQMGCISTDAVFVSLIDSVIYTDTTICAGNTITLSSNKSINSFATGVLCATADEGNNVTINAPLGAIISQVNFASYGTPIGSCGNFNISGCHAGNSKSIVESYLIGNNSGVIPATNSVFGDPCVGTYKRLYVEVTYFLLSDSNTYLWSNGATTATIQVNPNQSTTYYCSTTSKGVTTIDSFNIEVLTNPIIQIPNNVATCGSSIILDAGIGNHSTYLWNDSSNGQTLTVTKTGVYSVVKTEQGCSTSDTINVDFLNFDLGNDTVLYTGQSINLKINDIAFPKNDTLISNFNYRGTYKGHSYFLSENEESWQDAKLICENNGGYLACLNDSSENIYVSSLYTLNNLWIGLFQDKYDLSYSEPFGGWKWVSNEPLVFTSWGVGEPNQNAGYPEDFASTNHWLSIGIWNDLTSDSINSVKLKYVLEREKKSNFLYLWSTGDTTPTINVSPKQTTTYYCTISNGTTTCTDSVVVTVLPINFTSISESICQGNSFNFHGKYLTESGIYTDTLSSINSIDSIVTLSLIVRPMLNGSVSASICAGQSYSFAGKNYTAAGTYSDTSLNVTGCDSITTLQLTVKAIPSISLNDSLSVCGSSTILDAGTGTSATYLWNDGSTGQTLTVSNSGKYTVAKTMNGCTSRDSVVVDILTLDLGQNINICQGEKAEISANITTNAYLENLFNGQRYIQTPLSGPVGQTQRTFSFWVNTLDSSAMNILNYGVQNYNESVDLMLNLDLWYGAGSGWCNQYKKGVSFHTPTFASTFAKPVYDGKWHHIAYVMGENNNFSFDQIGIYVDGVLISKGPNKTLYCGHNWGGWTYNTKSAPIKIGAAMARGGYFKGNLKNIAIWDTALNNSQIQFVIKNGAMDLPKHLVNFYPLNRVISDSIVEDLVGNNSGVLKGLSTQKINTKYSLENVASYLWSTGETTPTIHVSPKQTTTYYCTISNGTTTCTDSVVVTVLPIPVTSITASICQGNSYNFHGKNLTESGVYSDTLSAVNSCDSVVTLNLNVRPVLNGSVSASICSGQTYSFAGKNYTAAGTYSDTSLNVLGCDSITTLQLTVKAIPSISLNDSLSVCGSSTILDAGTGTSATYLWNDGSTGQALTVSKTGVYSVVKTEQGCSASDSIIVDFLNIDLGNDTSICFGNSIKLSVSLDDNMTSISNSTNNSSELAWELLISNSQYNGNEINFNSLGFNKKTQIWYSVYKNNNINRVYAFDFKNKSVSSLNSFNAPGELYSYTYDGSNERIIASRVGRDAVYELPLNGGNWNQIGSGNYDSESYGSNAFWNPISNRYGFFGGYGWFATKNWVWENNNSNWINTYVNNNNCIFPKRVGNGIATNGNGNKIYIFSGQGNCDGNQFASSCNLGSPWPTDVGIYCWLKDLWELDLSTNQISNILPVNNQSINRHGAFAYDFSNNVFYNIGGRAPTNSYGVYTPFSMEISRLKSGIDSEFKTITASGLPPTADRDGIAVYDSIGNRIIYARNDGIWALNITFKNPISYLWSTGDTTPTINVSPQQTTTYYCTIFNGTTTCTDSVVVTVLPIPVTSISASICQGNTYNFHGKNLTESGVYSDTLSAVNSCDSIVTLTLDVHPLMNGSVIASICPGETYSFAGKNYTASGTYTDTSLNVFGCDSITTLELTVKQPTVSNANASICSGKSYNFYGQTLTATGTYQQTLVNAVGCDSVVTLTLNVRPILNGSVSASICSGETYSFAGKNYNAAGTYTDTSLNVFGCDSITTLELIVKAIPSILLNDSLSVCGSSTILDAGTGTSATYLWNDGSTGQALTVSKTGVYSVVKTEQGCTTSDSINVDFLNIDLGNDTIVCAGQLTELRNLKSNFINLDINSRQYSGMGQWSFGNNDSIISCYSWTYGLPGMLVFGDSTTSVGSLEAEITFPSNNFFNAGIAMGVQRNHYNDSYPFNGPGCYFLAIGSQGELTLYPGTANTPSGYWTAYGGVANVFIPNFNANIKYSLKLEVLDSGVINGYVNGLKLLTYQIPGKNIPIGKFALVASNNCYQFSKVKAYNTIEKLIWSTGDTTPTINVSPKQTTTYYCTISNGITTCTDSIVVTVLPIPITSISASICQGNSYNFHGKNLTETGVYSDTLSAVNSCDSIVTLTLNVRPVLNGSVSASICSGQSYTFAGKNYTAAGTYSDTSLNIFGCDSITTLQLKVNPLPNVNISATGSTLVCNKDVVIVGQGTGTWIWNTGATTSSIIAKQSGNYFALFTDINGCSNNSNSIIITRINTVPIISETILGDPNPCTVQGIGKVMSYGIAPVTNASSYNWTVLGGMNQLSRLDSNYISVTFPSNFVSGSLKITANNICGSSLSKAIYFRTVGISTSPSISCSVQSMYSNIQNGSTVNFNANALGANGYIWSVPTGLNIVSGQGSSTLTVRPTSAYVGGNVYCSADYGCNIGNPGYISIPLLSIPNITGPVDVCKYIGKSDTISYSVPIDANCTYYFFQLPSGMKLMKQVSNTIYVQVLNGFTGGYLSAKYYYGTNVGKPKNVMITASSCARMASQSMIGIEIYPNPTSGQVTLQLNSPASILVNLYSNDGKLVRSEHLINIEKGVLDFSGLSNGMYQLEIQTIDDKQKSFRKIEKLIIDK